jgi:hypothetical protein
LIIEKRREEKTRKVTKEMKMSSKGDIDIIGLSTDMDMDHVSGRDIYIYRDRDRDTGRSRGTFANLFHLPFLLLCLSLILELLSSPLTLAQAKAEPPSATATEMGGQGEGGEDMEALKKGHRKRYGALGTILFIVKEVSVAFLLACVLMLVLGGVAYALYTCCFRKRKKKKKI